MFGTAIGTSQSVTAVLSYLVPQSSKPVNYAYPPPDGQPWENCTYADRAVQIRDARSFLVEPSLEACGFELVHAPSMVRNFEDDDQVRDVYYDELKAIALEVTGGQRAYVFDHQVRRRVSKDAPFDFGRKNCSKPSAVGRVHNDYTERSGRRRFQLVLGEQAAREAAGQRYCIVNVWRGLKSAVLDAPLALCDSRSIQAADLVEAEMRYESRVGELYLGTANAAHRWAYFHAMQPDEAVVFKQFDSSPVASRFTLHAAFEHPETPSDAPPRQSIEARILVVY